MTEKQKRFADEYLIDLNGTRAYKAAYPNVKKDTVAAANASKLLRNAKVKNYIDKRLEEIHNDKTADAKEVIEYLTSVMRGETTDEVLRMVNGTQTKSELSAATRDRLRAAELLGKYFSLFTDKVQVSGDAVVIVDDLGET